MEKITAYECFTDGNLVGLRSVRGKDRLVISEDVADLLKFLRYDGSDTLRAVWNLDMFLSPVIGKLPKPILERLNALDPNLDYAGHHLYYIPKYVWQVGKSRFYGIQRYWSTAEQPPATLEELQDKADELMETLNRIGITDPKRLSSAIATFEDTPFGVATYEGIPKAYDIPCWQNALQYAYEADAKEWISNYAIGHWAAGSNEDYDICSAYGEAASKLYDLRDCEFWKSDKIGKREQGASYGWIKGRMSIDPKMAWCSPVMDRVGQREKPGNPAGDLPEATYTLSEVRFVENRGIGEFRITDGWFAKPCGGVRPRFPFKDIMVRLYEKRAISPLASSIVKNISVSIVGKLIEKKFNGEYGKWRNDFYHSLITADTRVKVASFLLDNDVREKELLSVQTDGVRLAKLVSTPKHNGMGTWRRNESAPLIVVAPGRVYTGDKKPGHLTYDEIVSMVVEHPLSKYYGKQVEHTITFLQAKEAGDLSLVGTKELLPAHLDLNTIHLEQNREFKALPTTGQQLLTKVFRSKPIVMEVK